ncbi:D-amino-acid oxidase [Kwoniella mangroviensis CBS 10435]|uniref:D-amino-acid oxidase n=1 Tax=Kwoniella mangroviensis CBS 10435 TaxID=1331196 RepID=A0A1B9IQZ5_9TREE|nr:D-amino-acid oxidase [Kwoniella mangroviensis CBS 10435]
MYDAVVIGSGVVGLSIALELHDRGIKVAVVARDIADDSNSIGFASPWAGCNWYSFANGRSDPASEWDEITYKGLEKVAKERPDLCEKIPVWDVYSGKKKEEEKPWYKDLVTDYRDLEATPSNPLPGGKPYATNFKTWCLHAPNYTRYLGDKLRSLGVPLIRHRLSSLDEAYNLPSTGKVNLVINATGLGARSLIGVEDDKVYPARGQTVLVKAPWVKEQIFHVEGFFAGKDQDGDETAKAPPQAAYIIPRPGPEGHVVLGGHYRVGDWSTCADLKEAERILKDCYNLCPKLAGPNGRSWRDIEVIAHNVGLRPAREGGARVELEHRQIGKKGFTSINPTTVNDDMGRKVAVVHAYGVGGAGFQNSMGLAVKVSDLAVGYLKSSSSNRAKL